MNGFPAPVGLSNRPPVVRIRRVATFDPQMIAWQLPLVLIGIAASAAGTDTFESLPPGGFTSHASGYGELQAATGHASIIAGKGRGGGNGLHLTGGDNRTLTLRLTAPTREPRALGFWAERWTRRGVCEFRAECQTNGRWSSCLSDNGIKVGGFLTHLEARVPAATTALRFTCTSEAGVLIDDLVLTREGPMEVLEPLAVSRPVVPVLRRRPFNPVLGFTLTTDGTAPPVALETVELSLAGTTRPQDLAAVALVTGGPDPGTDAGETVATLATPGESAVLSPRRALRTGANAFWISVTLKPGADPDGRVVVSLRRITAGGRVLVPKPASATVSQRIGVALRLRGEDGAHSYRIPGLVRTKAGSLVAAYDIRYGHCGDLPAQIDVGISRSTDGGRTWEPMRIAMDCATMGDPYAADGVGDPAILADPQTGRLWLAALWSHGNRAWNGSGPGLKPAETGQLLLTHSDDDGRTWAPLRNLTTAIKDPSWRLAFNGPGAGIRTTDGILVFPAQFRAADGGATQGKPFATVLTSKDGGDTWAIGTGAKIDTTEAQVAELPDGSLMLNCRDNRGGSRTVMVTRDLGRTWTPHATDRAALPEPVCMASLLRWDHPRRGTLFAFSNPATTRGRQSMTVKLSTDAAATWPAARHTLYDSRPGAGYSCLAPVDDDHLGVLYEGPCELYFLRLPLTECLK